MTNEKKLTLGAIGLGYWGKNIFRTAAGLPSVHLKWGCDEDEKTLQTLGQTNPGTKFTTQLNEVLFDSEVDGVLIATPSESHYVVARAALEAGKHTFVEKPLAMNLKHAEQLVHLAEKAKRTLMVGHLMKHHPAVNHLKRMIDAGEFGEVHYVYTQRLNLGIIRSDESPLWSLSPHDLSMILYLLGEVPTEVSAAGASFLQKGIEDVIFSRLHFASGKLAHMHLSWLDPHKIRSVTVVGSKKMAVFDDMEVREKLRIYDKGATKSHNPVTLMEYMAVREGDISIPKMDATEPLRLEIQNFADVIQGKAKSRSEGSEGVDVLRVIMQLQDSLRQGGLQVKI